jgi:hypothetical protein
MGALVLPKSSGLATYREGIMQKKNREKSPIKNRSHVSSLVIVVLLFHVAPGLTLKYQHSVDLEKSQIQQEFTLNLKEGAGR